MFQMYGGFGNLHGDDIDNKIIYYFPIGLSMISIGSAIYLIDCYVKKNVNTKKIDKYRDYGIVLIVLPVVSLILLLVGHLKIDFLKFFSFFISIINLILIVVTAIDINS
jgi:hypothetical protein